jgi:2-polyprenyl-6-hydroxyphenyl methylase/3-demethylubiquinone-9 3-methyltransferase
MDAPATDGSVVPDYGWDRRRVEPAHAYLLAPLRREIARQDAERPDREQSMRIFDAGCGDGTLLGSLEHAGLVLAGCDASASGVRSANERWPKLRIEVCSIYDDLAARFGSSWDAVVSSEVIEHLYAPRAFVRRARELLRPGGRLILSTPYHGYVKNLVLAASGRLDAHFTALWDGGHIKFWSYRTLTALLSEAGFSEFRFIGAGRVPFVWKSMIVTARRDGS